MRSICIISQMVTTAVLGVAGFSGQETLDRVLAHPELELVALGSDSLAGQPAPALDPRLSRNGHGALPGFVPNADALAAGAELVFCCLDNEGAAALEPPSAAVVVDLSGAHRIGSDGWCYALPELAPPTGRLIANPGCYATAALLALAPLAGIVDPDAGVVVDGKSGISGAGRTLKHSSHAVAVLDNVTPYAVGTHRHAPEIAQQLGFPVTFVPHVVPLRRGLVCTCYVSAAEDPRPLLEAAYAESHVVEVIDAVPDIARLQGTDAAEVAAFQDGATGRWIVICAIDNLGKGAAGQAVQNANLALGLDETAGLRLTGVLV
jgi:N-acetyl-gamma-glutamyl-phosphate reductase